MISRISNLQEQSASLSAAISEIALARFRTNPRRELRRITCNAEGGVLVLEGRLTSFYHKQIAQELVANIDGVVQVVNHIEVVNAAERS